MSDETYFGGHVAEQMERAMAMPLDTDILTGRTTMHRLTIHRTHDNEDIEFDFDLPDERELVTVLKEALKYDMDTPVWAFVVVADDGGLRGVSVPSHQIDHMTIEPIYLDKGVSDG